MRGDIRELLHSDPVGETRSEVRVKVDWQVETEKEKAAIESHAKQSGAKKITNELEIKKS